MDDEVIDYMNEQLSIMNEKYNELTDLIRLKKIEANLIEGKVKNIQDLHDDTSDALLPEHCNDNFNHNEIESLLDSRTQLITDNEIMIKEKEALSEKISHLKKMISNMKDNQRKESQISVDDVNSFRIQELDRERISRDIHDGVIQNLTALIRKMEFVSKIVSNDSARAKIEINNSKESLKASVKEVRDVIYDLRPMALDDLGFEAAFYEMCDKLKSDYNGIFEYSFSSELSLEEQDNYENVVKDIMINVLRISKELCSNSIKYSNGNHISVEIYIDKKGITLIQSDDGTDFDYFSFVKMKKDNTGYGLIMLNERVQAFHGTFDFDNNNGTRYTITFPIS